MLDTLYMINNNDCINALDFCQNTQLEVRISDNFKL